MKELNDVGPTSIAHIIGQTSVVDQQVSVALDAAFEDGKRLDSAFWSDLRVWERAKSPEFSPGACGGSMRLWGSRSLAVPT